MTAAARGAAGRLRRLLRRLLPRLGLREDDVILASFPKSGNTWVRFLWANVVALEEMEGREVDFHVLERDFGWEYGTLARGDGGYGTLPRLVKTHRPRDRRAFGRHRSVYLLRHPGDVMVSGFHYHRARRAGAPAPERFSAFLRSPEVGLPAWCRHVRGWIGEATVVLRYRELRDDAAAALGRVLEELGLGGIPRATLREAARRSSFSSLRRLEEERGRPREERFRPEHRFMRSGGTGEWRRAFDDGQAAYLRRTVEEHGLSHLVELGAGDDGAV